MPVSVGVLLKAIGSLAKHLRNCNLFLGLILFPTYFPLFSLDKSEAMFKSLFHLRYKDTKVTFTVRTQGRHSQRSVIQ